MLTVDAIAEIISSAPVEHEAVAGRLGPTLRVAGQRIVVQLAEGSAFDQATVKPLPWNDGRAASISFSLRSDRTRMRDITDRLDGWSVSREEDTGRPFAVKTFEFSPDRPAVTCSALIEGEAVSPDTAVRRVDCEVS